MSVSILSEPIRRAFAALLLLLAGVAGAAEPWDAGRGFFPGADRVGAVEGTPPAVAVYRGKEVLGYLFQTNDVERIPAYSGKPVNTLVGIDLAGRITGAKVLEHHEPILLVGIPEQKLTDFIHQYIGKSVTDRVKVGAGHREGYVGVDAITGATVDPAKLALIAGKPSVNVNVFSGRKSSQDNLISCDFIDGPVDELLAAPTEIACGLISEDPVTVMKPAKG